MNGFMRGARLLTVGAAIVVAACGGDSATGEETPPPAPVLTSVHVALATELAEVGQATVATATPFDQNGAVFSPAVITFASSAPTVAGVNPATGAIFAISAGTTQITATAAGKMGTRTFTVFKSPIRLNEVKPNGDGPGGWIELFNPSADAVDVSGWTVTGSDILQGFTLPGGVVIPAGGYRIINESEFPAGLRAADAVHVFSKFGVQVDSFQWITDPVVTYGRCPDGNGPLVPTIGITRGGVNACGS